MTAQVLLVDDDPLVLRSLARLLRSDGYEVLTADSGPGALQVLAAHDAAVIVSDHQMAGMTGPEVLAQALRIRPDAFRIILTGCADLPTALSAINAGQANQLLLKPWDDNHLRAVVRDGVQRCAAAREIKTLHELTRRQRDELSQWNQRLEATVLQRTAELRASYEDTLNALVLALDAREHATAGHSTRVALYCLYLAAELGLPDERREDIYRGARLHDIGKIGVPDDVLLKRGGLTAPERAIMQRHVTIGADLLERVRFLRPAAVIVRCHHERFDGGGYCAGLAREAIPIEARVFSIVDVYDALRCERPYKQPFTHEHACRLIAQESKKQFDPNVVAAFLGVPVAVWDALAGHATSVASFPEARAASAALRATRSQHAAAAHCTANDVAT